MVLGRPIIGEKYHKWWIIWFRYCLESVSYFTIENETWMKNLFGFFLVVPFFCKDSFFLFLFDDKKSEEGNRIDDFIFTLSFTITLVLLSSCFWFILPVFCVIFEEGKNQHNKKHSRMMNKRFGRKKICIMFDLLLRSAWN